MRWSRTSATSGSRTSPGYLIASSARGSPGSAAGSGQESREMRADRAFRDLIAAAVGALATITVPLAITLFPGDLQRALHGYDALAETCALALYRLGSALPPLGAVVLALACALIVAGGAQAAGTIWRTHRALRSRKRVPSPPQLVRAAARAGIVSGTVCFDDLRPIAYCAGLVRPRVWVSRGA